MHAVRFNQNVDQHLKIFVLEMNDFNLISILQHEVRDIKKLIEQHKSLIKNKAISLKQIVLPQTIKYIDKCAFEGCISITEIVIPNSVLHIDDYAFSGCSSMQKIAFQSSTLTFGEKVFDGIQSIEICGKITKNS